jgi:Asp-tRNA(Asn)/Glu-tRNA(Gln) amidotransferase A subunit family amidase
MMPPMTVPWQADACSLVEEFRAGRRSPAEEVEATLAAIAVSGLNAFEHVDAERARAAAERAELGLPFGGVPVGVKQLERLQGWPFTEGSLVFADRVADVSSTMMERLVERGGAVPLGTTTASEFGGLNVSVNRLNGVTHNPWRHGRTAGGSSGGSAAAVAGGLVPLATGGDGGGSIRIPAGYTGLLGLKGTYGRIPRGPRTTIRPSTVVLGCLARSVRDTARYLDVCAGHHPTDPTSLPARGPWEAGLGAHDLSRRTVIVEPGLGGVPLTPEVEARVREAADHLVGELGLRRVTAPLGLPRLGVQWVMGNITSLMVELGDRWPGCAPLLTEEVAAGVYLSQSLYNLRVAAEAETERIQANEAMAAAFTEADFIICATNPDPAFPAGVPMSAELTGFVGWARRTGLLRRALPVLFGAARVGAGVGPSLPSHLLEWASEHLAAQLEMGALTMVSNVYGNPAVSIPIGTVDGLPVGMQVLARHHQDGLLLDLAAHVERSRPWPHVAPGAPV